MSSERTSPVDGWPCWIEIPARDVEKLKTFYSSLFPSWTWTETDHPHDGPPVALFEFKKPKGLGGGIIKMPEDCGPNSQTLGSGVTVYHMVESLEKTEARIHALGGKTVLPKTAQGEMGYFINATDPEGNRIGIYQLRSTEGEGDK
ncbi:hypothetical protein H2200_007192 [Cladophialophora chaetospira]|uniref:VOC domain-containing protein n=1 Tax=Cladophialophora chaetospira TaxID=386627 RepID=A0AA39CH90_9EURO|nr:hypothetical protein H2200_007192 [Cladophialophora chaetospira]